MRAFIFLFLLCCLLPAASARGLDVGARAPSIGATLLDGRRFESGAQSGKVVIVHFWATWCAPCREEMPVLDAFYRAHRDEGLVVVAISLDERGDLAKVEQAMRGLSYPAALLEDTQAKGYGRIWRVPVTFAIDRHGLLRRDGFMGSPKLDAATLERDVLPLLRDR